MFGEGKHALFKWFLEHEGGIRRPDSVGRSELTKLMERNMTWPTKAKSESFLRKPMAGYLTTISCNSQPSCSFCKLNQLAVSVNRLSRTF